MQRGTYRCKNEMFMVKSYYEYFGGGACVYQGKLQFRIQRREVSKTFLKTVSAYANYNDGAIIFGLDGNGKKSRVTVLNDLKNYSLVSETKINGVEANR